MVPQYSLPSHLLSLFPPVLIACLILRILPIHLPGSVPISALSGELHRVATSIRIIEGVYAHYNNSAGAIKVGKLRPQPHADCSKQLCPGLRTAYLHSPGMLGA